MPRMTRDSGGPQGRPKTSWPVSGLPKLSRQDAGVGIACLDCDVRAAGRGVGAQDAASPRGPTPQDKRPTRNPPTE